MIKPIHRLALTALLGLPIGLACSQDNFAGSGKKASADAKKNDDGTGSGIIPKNVSVPVGETKDPIPASIPIAGCKVDDPKIASCDPKTGAIKGLAPGETKVHVKTPTGDQVVDVTVTPDGSGSSGRTGTGSPGGTGTSGTGSPGDGTSSGTASIGTDQGSGTTTGNPSIDSSEAAFACDKGQVGLVGKVYKLPEGTNALPNLDAMTPIGQITALNLDVPPRKWEDGFPALPGLIEWFAIKFFAELDAPVDGSYVFQTISDDGSKVYIDDALVVNNDGTHAPTAKESAPIHLTKGRHLLTVEWFQGPRVQIALQLGWKKPGDADFSFVPAEWLHHGTDCTLKPLGQFP